MQHRGATGGLDWMDLWVINRALYSAKNTITDGGVTHSKAFSGWTGLDWIGSHKNLVLQEFCC